MEFKGVGGCMGSGGGFGDLGVYGGRGGGGSSVREGLRLVGEGRVALVRAEGW